MKTQKGPSLQDRLAQLFLPFQPGVCQSCGRSALDDLALCAECRAQLIREDASTRKRNAGKVLTER